MICFKIDFSLIFLKLLNFINDTKFIFRFLHTVYVTSSLINKYLIILIIIKIFN